MPKKNYKCEVCGKRNYVGQVVCCLCVERDLTNLEKRITAIEKHYALEQQGEQDG